MNKFTHSTSGTEVLQTNFMQQSPSWEADSHSEMQYSKTFLLYSSHSKWSVKQCGALLARPKHSSLHLILFMYDPFN
jgi:hypothetical protein